MRSIEGPTTAQNDSGAIAPPRFSQSLNVMRIRFLALAIMLATVACDTLPRNVTGNNAVREAGWVEGEVYETKQPTFLLYDEVNEQYWLSRSNAKHLSEILAHQCGPFALPRSLKEYRGNPQKWPEIRSILPPGSKIRFEEAKHLGFPYGSELSGRTRKGSFIKSSKEITVDLECIAIADTESQQWRRDPKWLAK